MPHVDLRLETAVHPTVVVLERSLGRRTNAFGLPGGRIDVKLELDASPRYRLDLALSHVAEIQLTPGPWSLPRVALPNWSACRPASVALCESSAPAPAGAPALDPAHRRAEGNPIVDLGIVGQALGLFVVTNIDDIVVLALFFAQGAGHHGSSRRILLGQYLGFAVILGVAVAAAFGSTFLPEEVLPYLGVLPLALGVKAAVDVLRHRNADEERAAMRGGPTILAVAAVTLANGGDNLGVYVPVFATAGIGGMTVYLIVFLVLVAVWVAAGRSFATRPAIAKALARWGHILLPIVLIGIGLLILIEGGAFGL